MSELGRLRPTEGNVTLMAIGTIFRTVLELSMPEGVTATLNKYIRAESQIPSVDYPDLVANVATWWDEIMGHMESSIATNVSAEQVVVYHVDDATGDETVLDDATITFNPSASGGLAPHGAAALLTAQVFQDRGVLKLFFPGIADSLLSAEALWNGTVLADLALAGVPLLLGPNDVNGVDLEAGSWNGDNQVFKPIGTSATASAIPAYQRRRKPGVGI